MINIESTEFFLSYSKVMITYLSDPLTILERWEKLSCFKIKGDLVLKIYSWQKEIYRGCTKEKKGFVKCYNSFTACITVMK